MKNVRKIFDILSIALMGAVAVGGLVTLHWGAFGVGFLGASLGIRVFLLGGYVEEQRTAQVYLLRSVQSALDHPKTRAAMQAAVDEAKALGRAQAAEMCG